ncbi:hypothetical protein ACFPPD_19305 [Cohnella suwonensis]|uniref:Uncharacterized protein n=1 Tax=Cohnella suwonensis TaxID=696072 RepID=A0ABW0LYF3_9BACL
MTTPPKAWWDDAMARFNTKNSKAVQAAAQSMKAHFPIWDVLMFDDKPLLCKRGAVVSIYQR